jgi:Cohesin domain
MKVVEEKIHNLWIIAIVACVAIVGLVLISRCTVTVCNNNGICEPSKGETAANCAGDCVVSPAGTAVYVNPGATGINIGDTVTLEIRASSITNLFGYQFDISYDPSILEFSGMQDGTLLSNNGQYQTFCVDYAASSGKLSNIACSIIGSSGVSGSGLLKRVSFRALTSGTSDVLLSNVKLADSNSARISSTVLSGRVIVS